MLLGPAPQLAFLGAEQLFGPHRKFGPAFQAFDFWLFIEVEHGDFGLSFLVRDILAVPGNKKSRPREFVPKAAFGPGGFSPSLFCPAYLTSTIAKIIVLAGIVFWQDKSRSGFCCFLRSMALPTIMSIMPYQNIVNGNLSHFYPYIAQSSGR